MLTLRNTETSFFHVHTYRCGHAEDIPDEAYVKQAIACGASDIWFTDHAPFPGDPFGARMRYAELDEYLETLTASSADTTHGMTEHRLSPQRSYRPQTRPASRLK